MPSWKKSDLSIKVEVLPELTGAAYITMVGDGDATNVMDLVDQLEPLFRKNFTCFAFDMERLRYFQETFEGLVTNQAVRLNGGEGLLLAVRMHPNLRNLMDMLSLSAHYRFAKSRQDAIEQMRARASKEATR